MIDGNTILIAHIGYPTRDLQSAHDLQPVLKKGGYQRRCHDYGRQG
jgi:hypothetical protein